MKIIHITDKQGSDAEMLIRDYILIHTSENTLAIVSINSVEDDFKETINKCSNRYLDVFQEVLK